MAISLPPLKKRVMMSKRDLMLELQTLSEPARMKETQENLIKQILDSLPEKKSDTRGTTQNPDNPRYLTKSATAYNQALSEVKQAILKVAEDNGVEL